MAGKVRFVEYQGADLIKVANWLAQKGYGIADDYGTELVSLNELNSKKSLGVLFGKPRPTRKWFNFRKVRRVFLGIIYCDDSIRHANNKNWVFEIYGGVYCLLAKQLAEEMASIFDVNVVVNLMREDIRRETFWEDFAQF